MEFQESSAWIDAMRIMNNQNAKPNASWKYILITPQEQLLPLYVINIVNRKDSAVGYADELQVTMVFGAGVYAKRIMPHRTDLKIKLIRIPVSTQSRASLDESEIEETEYTAIIRDKGQNPTVGQGREDDDEETLNMSAHVECTFQLIDPVIERLRGITVGGVARKTTIENAMRSFISQGLERINLDDQAQAIESIEIDQVNNEFVYEQIVIPHGTPLIELPRFLQKRYGVYSTGLGSYIHNKVWHVFPLFNTSRFEQRATKAIIIVLPKNKFSQLEVTYDLQDDGNIVLLTTSQTGFRDDSGSQFLTHGNGVKFTDLTKLYSAIEVKDNKATLRKAQATNSFVCEEKQNKVNLVQVAPDRSTANPFVVYSQLSARTGAIYKFIWENSQVDALYPGMACKVVYFDEEQISSIDGVISYIANVTQNVSGIFGDAYVNQSSVVAYVRPDESDPGAEAEDTLI